MSRARVLGVAVALLGAITALIFMPARGTEALMTATTANATNVAANLALVGPTGLTATGGRNSVTLSWTAAPSGGNGNGYAISAKNTGASSTCPTTIAGYDTWIGGSTGTTYTDTGAIAQGPAFSYVCYAVQTGYSPAGGPPWASAPLWTSQGTLLTVAILLASPTLLQNGGEATGTASVTPSLASATMAHDFLVATVAANETSTPLTASAGWTRAARSTEPVAGAVEIWYLADAPASAPAPTFSDPAATAMWAVIAEYAGVATTAPLDVTGTASSSILSKTATVSTSASTAVAGELAITIFGTGAATTFPSGTGWSNLFNDGTSGYISDYQVQSLAGVESETMTAARKLTWAAAIATFR